MKNRWYQNIHGRAVVVIIIFIFLDAYVWFIILGSRGVKDANAEFYFLDVGQGDSELITVPYGHSGNVNLLIDGGPDAKVVDRLKDALPAQDHYIDILVMTHPQLDHFGGLIDVLKNYDVGAFLWTGRKGTSMAYAALESEIKKRGVQTIILRAGDEILYNKINIKVLSPDERMLKSEELNDTSLVLLANSADTSILYTGDIGENIEKILMDNGIDLKASILKVPHHGSRFSSSDRFLRAVNPLAAIIEVGKNSYGHPTKQPLERLKNIGANIFTTKNEGTVRIEIRDQKLYVYKQ